MILKNNNNVIFEYRNIILNYRNVKKQIISAKYEPIA